MMNQYMEIFATVLDSVFLIWFMSKFHEVVFYKKPLVLFFPLGLLLFELIGDKILPAYGSVYLGVAISIVASYSLFLSHGNFKRALYSSCLFFTVIFISGALLTAVFSFFTKSTEAMVYGSNTDDRLIFLVVAKMLQFALYKFILHIFGKDKYMDIKCSLIVFVLTIATMCGLVTLVRITMLYDSVQIHLPILIIAAVLIISNIALYYLIYLVQKLLKTKYELRLLQEKMNFEKSRYEEATVVWDNIRKVRHDMKNHFAVISGHLKNEDTKACEEYIEQIMPSVESMGNLIRSNNSVLDYLINSKLSGLKETQIVISGVVSNFDDVEDTDLASIIGNVLDNAVEAQERVTGIKRIELMFRMMNENRVIICKNTVSESVLKTNKELRSTKKNHDDHGLGHQIVETILKKYDGWVDYFETEDMFGVQVMLPMPRQNNII